MNFEGETGTWFSDLVERLLRKSDAINAQFCIGSEDLKGGCALCGVAMFSLASGNNSGYYMY